MAPPIEDKPAINLPLENIREPGVNDVLSGRGVSTNRNKANVNFRSLVSLNKELYVTSTKKQKMAISRSIVDAVRSMEPPGRFLDKDPETGLWYDIGNRKAIEKTSQALRDGAAALRKQLSQDLGDPGFLDAVFEMDTSNNSSKTTTSTEPSNKEKAKPIKAKPPVKKGHRRTKSNPHTLAEKKRAVAVKKHKAEASVEHVQKPVLSPLNLIGSLPPSPMMNRATFGRASSFDYAHSSPYPGSPTPVSSGAPPYPVRSGPSLKCASFDSATHSWQYGRRHSGQPPLSPSSLPGRHPHPLSPHGSYSRPPISPVHHHHHQPWSPGSYSRTSPGFRSWRASPTSPYGYSRDLSVPALGRKASESSAPRVPLSPVRSSSSGARENMVFRPPMIMRAGSAEDFVPPLSPGSWVKPKQEKIIVAKPMKMEVDKSDDDAYTSAGCTLFGGCFMMDTETSDVEVLLSKDKREDVSTEANPAEDEEKNERLSPLPFSSSESETTMSFFETLLQLPIAPCAPQDVE